MNPLKAFWEYIQNKLSKFFMSWFVIKRRKRHVANVFRMKPSFGRGSFRPYFDKTPCYFQNSLITICILQNPTIVGLTIFQTLLLVFSSSRDFQFLSVKFSQQSLILLLKISEMALLARFGKHIKSLFREATIFCCCLVCGSLIHGLRLCNSLCSAGSRKLRSLWKRQVSAQVHRVFT